MKNFADGMKNQIQIAEEMLSEEKEYSKYALLKERQEQAKKRIVAFQTLISLAKRVDEGEIRDLLGEWNISDELGLRYKLTQAIVKYLKGER